MLITYSNRCCTTGWCWCTKAYFLATSPRRWHYNHARIMHNNLDGVSWIQRILEREVKNSAQIISLWPAHAAQGSRRFTPQFTSQLHTVLMCRIWTESKQQPSKANPGHQLRCCLFSHQFPVGHPAHEHGIPVLSCPSFLPFESFSSP